MSTKPLYEIDLHLNTVNVKSQAVDIETCLRRVERGLWNLTPEYQRSGGVWTYQQRSRLIESLLIGLPVPPVFLMASSDGGRSVADGLQRLLTVSTFMAEPSWALRKLDLLPELTGAYFSDLSERLQERLRTATLTIVEVEPSTNPNVREVYRNARLLAGQVFDRLNSGTPVSTGEKSKAVLFGNTAGLIQQLRVSVVHKSEGSAKRSEDYTFAQWLLAGYLARRAPLTNVRVHGIRNDTAFFGRVHGDTRRIFDTIQRGLDCLDEKEVETLKANIALVSDALVKTQREHLLKNSAAPTVPGNRRNNAAAFLQMYLTRVGVEKGMSREAMTLVWEQFIQYESMIPRFLSVTSRRAMNARLDKIDDLVEALC